MSPRILVTGGTGFVGSFVVEALLAAGLPVRATVRDPNRLSWLQGLPVELAVGAIEDSVAMAHAVEGCQAVVHCAGLTKAIRVNDLYRINGNATTALVRAAQEQGVSRFVYCSSLAAAGPALSAVPLTEQDIAQPVSEYGRSKLAGESAVRQHAGDMSWIIVRPPSVFGPRDDQFVPLFKGICKLGRYPLWGKTAHKYSLVYVKDLARVLAQTALNDKNSGEIFYCTNPTPTTWPDFSRIIAAAYGRSVKPLRLPLPFLKIAAPIMELTARIQGRPALLSREKVREILAGSWICSGDKLLQALGLKCDYDLTLAVTETIEDYRSRGILT